jgi:hypothetical protein
MKTFSDFSLNLFCLLFGFFLGNLFPNISLGLDFKEWGQAKLLPLPDFFRLDILIQTFSGIIPGPSQVGLFIVVVSELINWSGKFLRTKEGRREPPQLKFPAQKPIFPFLNSIKIGLLFGIFVDAFKVGS